MIKEEKDLNDFVDEAMEREADDYNRIEADADYMNSLMADAEELMPSEEFEEIEKPVHQLQDSIQQFQEAESLEGPQLETWQAFHPKHQEIIQNMQEMNGSYKQQAPEQEKMEARQRTTESVLQADQFIRAEYQKLMERDRKMQEEMAVMHEQLIMMQKIMENFSPQAMMQCMVTGMNYLKEAEAARNEAKKQPTKAHRSLYQAARESVHNVYQNIRQAPQRVCNAVKQKAYQEVDKGLKHIAGVFDRGIHALTERRNAILNLSPLAKQKEQPKQAVPEQKEKVKDEQQKGPDTAVISVQKLMDPASREKAVQALVESALAAGYNAQAIEKAFSDLKLAVISSSLSDTPVENQQINKKLDMPLTVAVLMDRDSVSKAGLIQYFGSQGMTKEQAVSQCDDWKKAADSYMQHKGLVKGQEKDKQR